MKVLFDNLIAMCSSMLAHYANPFNPMVCSWTIHHSCSGELGNLESPSQLCGWSLKSQSLCSEMGR